MSKTVRGIFKGGNNLLGMMSALYERCIRRRRFCILLTYVLFLLGVFIGLFFGSELIKNLIAFDFSVEYLEKAIGSTPADTVFLSRLADNARFFLVVSVFSFVPYLSFLNYIFFAYRGYVLGSFLFIVCGQFGMIGLLNSVVIVIPAQLMIITSLILYCQMTAEIRSAVKKRCFPLAESVKKFCFSFVVFYLSSLIAALYELIIITIIIMPFNLSV